MKNIIYDWNGLNAQIFYAINAVHGRAYDAFMILGTMLGKYYLFLLYMPLIWAVAYHQIIKKRNSQIIDYEEYRARWIKTLHALVLGFLVQLLWVEGLKNYLDMPRPFIALPVGTVTQLWIETPYSSFPSGHCSFAILMAVGLWPMLGRIGKTLAVFYVVWVGLSRVALGVHFPADVVGSIILSLINVWVIRKLVEKMLPIKTAKL